MEKKNTPTSKPDIKEARQELKKELKKEFQTTAELGGISSVIEEDIKKTLVTNNEEE